MECVEMYTLLVQFSLYLFSTVLSFYILRKIDNLIFKNEVIMEEQKNDFSYNIKDEANATASANKLSVKRKGDDYFTDDFYKLISRIRSPKQDYFKHFGRYVSMTLNCINSESYKQKLISEIHELIGETVQLDIEDFIRDTSANAQISNPVVESEMDCINKNLNKVKIEPK